MKKYQIEIKWALIFVAMTLLWMIGEKLSGLHDQYIDQHPIYTNFIAIPAIAIYVFALLDKRKNYYGGGMSYQQGFICGLIITAIITILSPFTQFITSTVITPEFFAHASEYAVQSGKSTAKEAEAFFNLNNYIVQGMVGAMVMGLLTTAIVAFFTKSKAGD